MSLSFMHCGGPAMASYRYRCEIPAKSLGAQINNPKANVLIFAKPMAGDLDIARYERQRGAKIIIDICDNHAESIYYQEMIATAAFVTCPTETLARIIRTICPNDAVFIVPDTYEREQQAPHCNGMNLLWFGHAVNADSLRSMNHGYAMRIVSNIPGTIPWSQQTLTDELARADIVLLPKNADYKSPNRALEAIRSGCFVVAEPHPSLLGLPVWQGNIKDGIEWANANPALANQMIREAQGFIAQKYSPAIQASAWRTALQALG